MVEFRVRPVQIPADYPRIADLTNCVDDEPVTVAELAENDAKIPAVSHIGFDDSGRLTGHCRQRWAAVDGAGHVIGYAASWRAPWDEPGFIWHLLIVDPDFRGQGVGSALYDVMERWAREQGGAGFKVALRDHHRDARDYAEKRGYQEERHVYQSVCDLATFNAPRFDGVVVGVEAGGIRFATLDDMPGEAMERTLCELHQRTSADIPGDDGQFPPFDQWREWVLARVRPEHTLIALDGERVVGMALLVYHPDTRGVYNLYTGVEKAYRGRHIALALKLLCIGASRELGAAYLRTDNDSRNAPMLAINRKLNYVPQPGWYWMTRKCR